MANKESGKALAEALKHNSVLTALDVSKNALYTFNDGPGFAQELAIGIKDNGAMTSLNLASNDICWGGYMDGIKAISSAVKVLATILVPF